MSARFAALLAYCGQRCPHSIWEDMARLDYAGDVAGMQQWLDRQLPIHNAVQVLWFAMWDVTTGFDLRGSTSWSRDPEVGSMRSWAAAKNHGPSAGTPTWSTGSSSGASRRLPLNHSHQPRGWPARAAARPRDPHPAHERRCEIGYRCQSPSVNSTFPERWYCSAWLSASA
jgi:hypothetical protein